MASSTYQRTGSNLAGTAVTLFFIASIISVTPALSLASETVLEHFWITNGEVRAVEESDGKVYLGGAFSAVGPAIGGVGIFDLGTGAIQAPYAAVRGSVHAIAPDASGGYYLGGDFLYVQGQFRQNAAHIDASGQLTAWNPEVNGYVYALAVSGSTVYMGGTFESVGGEPRTRLAAVDAVTGVPTSWSPFPESPGIVHAIFATPTTLYVGERSPAWTSSP